MTQLIADRGSWWRRWDLHIHTNASDGKGTCEEILEEAKKKKIRCTVTFASGAIENPVINKQIVDVLEGTYPAFHNRDCKYIEKT